ncbi:MAG: hypothetical protein E5W21_21290, partial [Mesorhizobium sp.]
LPCLWAAAQAQTAGLADLGSMLPGRTDVTYLDLARMVIPDLAADKGGMFKGGPPIEMPHVQGPDAGGSPPDTSSFSNASALALKVGGKGRLAMLFDLGDSPDSAEGYAVLALYDTAGKPTLLDAVNVALDRDTYFQEPGRLSVGANDDILMTGSSHSNSEQNYMITLLVMVVGDKFKLIDTIYTFDERLCAYSHTQDVAVRTVKDGRSHAGIKATVTDTILPNEESCDEAAPKASSHKTSVTYHWSKKISRYVADSDAFVKLSAENEKRF